VIEQQDGADGELVELVTREFAENHDFVRVVPVHLWTFTRSLNTILTLAAQLEATQLVYQSVEVQVESASIDALLERLQPGNRLSGSPLH